MKGNLGIRATLSKLEKYLPLIMIVAFILGIFLASISIEFANLVYAGITGFIDLFIIVAPIMIFMIVAPAMAKVLYIRKGGAFGAYATFWLSARRLMACVWAIVFTVIIFGFPLLPEQAPDIGVALWDTLQVFAKLTFEDPFLIALWVGIIVAIISRKSSKLYGALEKIMIGIEGSGKYFESLIPFFMFTVGGYVYALPQHLPELGVAGADLGTVNVLGYGIDASTSSGMITVYIVASLLVALACLIWHFALLCWIKRVVKGFSIKDYFTRYWIRVYPLLWATASEALAMPLNLHLVKKHFPKVKTTVRRFVIGMGSYLNINGTVICVFVMAGVVASMLGHSISLVEFLVAIPVVFIIGFGVPGIPGELVLFAVPLALILNIPTAIVPAFLALYIGLQLGLPDSFRTGNNSTDDCACAVLLNDAYNKKFARRGKR